MRKYTANKFSTKCIDDFESDSNNKDSKIDSQMHEVNFAFFCQSPTFFLFSKDSQS